MQGDTFISSYNFTLSKNLSQFATVIKEEELRELKKLVDVVQKKIKTGSPDDLLRDRVFVDSVLLRFARLGLPLRKGKEGEGDINDDG